MFAASGHFSAPNIPEFPGLDKFLGRVLHSHDFRSADEFAGKDVLCVGASYSSEDIGIQCYKYGAKSVTFSLSHAPMGFKWPENFSELPLLEKVEGKTVLLQGRHNQGRRCALFCAPATSPPLPLHGGHAAPQDAQPAISAEHLQGHLLVGAIPKLMYIGMQDQFYTFNMFDLQAWYARDVVLGRIKLPRYDEMAADIQKWIKLEEALEDPSQAIDFQTEYVA